MNGFTAWLHGALGWLGQQAHAAGSVIGAVTVNRPLPARSVLIYTVAVLVLAYVALRIVKRVTG